MYQGLTKESRIAARWVPDGFTKYEHAETGAVICLGDGARGPRLVAYVGSAAKPCANYYYRNAWERFRSVLEIIGGQMRAAAYRQERRDALKTPHSLELGHILSTCWGYEQTNVEFFEVVKIVSDRMVEIREIKAHSVDMGPGYSSMSGHVIPCPGEYVGEATRHRVNASNSVSFQKFRSASLWSGRPAYVSWYG